MCVYKQKNNKDKAKNEEIVSLQRIEVDDENNFWVGPKYGGGFFTVISEEAL